jgi:hypothetical protein
VVPTRWARGVSLTGSKWGPKLAGSRPAGSGPVNRVLLRFGLGEMAQVYVVRIILDQISGDAAGRCGKLVEVPRCYAKRPMHAAWRQPLRFSPVLPRNVAGQGLGSPRTGPPFHVIRPRRCVLESSLAPGFG